MKIVIYEDHERLREHLRLLLDGTDGLSVVGTFPNCQNVEAEMIALKPHLVLMDIDMPKVNGIEGVERIKSLNPAILVLMHTVFDDNDNLFVAVPSAASFRLMY